MTDATTPQKEPSDAAVTDTDADEEKMFNDFVIADRDNVDPEAIGSTQDEDDDLNEQQDEDTEAAPKGDASEPEPKPTTDIWADAPEDLRSAFEAERQRAEKLENRARSADGRVSSLQLRLNDLSKQMDAASQDGATKKEQVEATTEANKLFDSDDWKAFEEEFPEVAAPIRTVSDEQLKRVQALEGKFAAIDTEQSQQNQLKTEQAFLDNEERLTKSHSDWQEIAQSENFGNWLVGQPEYVQQAALANGNNIVDAAAAIDLIQRYKDANKPAESTGNDTDAGKSKTQAVKRSLQLESSTSPRAKGMAPVTTGVPDDPEAAFKYFVEQDAKKAQS